MKFAILGKPFAEETAPAIQALLDDLAARQAEVRIVESFRTYLDNTLRLPDNTTSFRRGDSLRGTNFVLSIGGDGTLLDTVTYVGALQIPILGIHTGRLGFLATVTPDGIGQAIDALYKGHFVLDDRSLNGVFVNGERTVSQMLADGDEIVIGRYRLHFVDRLPAAAPSAATALQGE